MILPCIPSLKYTCTHTRTHTVLERKWAYLSTRPDRYLSATLRILLWMWLKFTRRNCACRSSSSSFSLVFAWRVRRDRYSRCPPCAPGRHAVAFWQGLLYLPSCSGRRQILCLRRQSHTASSLKRGGVSTHQQHQHKGTNLSYLQTFCLEMILDLLRSCRESTEFPYTLDSTSPNTNFAPVKTKNWMLIHWYSLSVSLYLDSPRFPTGISFLFQDLIQDALWHFTHHVSLV